VSWGHLTIKYQSNNHEDFPRSSFIRVERREIWKSQKKYVSGLTTTTRRMCGLDVIVVVVVVVVVAGVVVSVFDNSQVRSVINHVSCGRSTTWLVPLLVTWLAVVTNQSWVTPPPLCNDHNNDDDDDCVTATDWLWPPCAADADIIFLPCGFFLLSSFFFSSPNLSGRRLDVYNTSTYGVALVRI